MPITYVRYAACLVWTVTMSLTGVLVATTTARAVTVCPALVLTVAVRVAPLMSLGVRSGVDSPAARFNGTREPRHDISVGWN